MSLGVVVCTVYWHEGGCKRMSRGIEEEMMQISVKSMRSTRAARDSRSSQLIELGRIGRELLKVRVLHSRIDPLLQRGGGGGGGGFFPSSLLVPPSDASLPFPSFLLTPSPASSLPFPLAPFLLLCLNA